jgi:hypothetical protein
MRLVEHAAQMREMKNIYKILAETPQGKGSLGKHSRRWKHNIKMNLKETGCEDVDRIHLVPLG